MLVDVDDHKGQPMLLLYDLQEVFSTEQLVDCFKRGAEAQTFVHFLHALLSVAFQAAFILFLDQFILLNTHLKLRKHVTYLQHFTLTHMFPDTKVCGLDLLF